MSAIAKFDRHSVRNASRRRRAVFESLESRRLLTTSVWTGAAGNHLFTDANNYQGNVAPAPGNDIAFPDLGTAQTVDINAASTVGNVFISGTYTFSDAVLTLGGDVSASASAVARFNDTIAITTNSHFTTDTSAQLQLNTLTDTSANVLDKFGTGTLTLGGDSNASWQLIDGTFTLAATTHIAMNQFAGTFNGTGTVASLNSTGGTVSLNNGVTPSTITTTGSTLISSSNVAVTLNNTGSFSSLSSAGGITLASGPTLTVTIASGFPTAGGTIYRIFDNTGTQPINGTFANLPQGATFDAGGERFSISYTGGTGNDIVLTTVGVAPIVTLTASAGTVLVGQPDVLTANVTGIAGPGSGIVTFTDNGVVLGTSGIDVNGNAVFNITNFPAGVHTVIATYAGDTNYLPGASNAVVITSKSRGPIVTKRIRATKLTAKTALLTARGTDTTTDLTNSLTYNWTLVHLPSGARVPIFSANGTHGAGNTTVSFTKDGTYHFRVTIRDTFGRTATSDLDYVVKQYVRDLRVTPHGATINKGSTVQFRTVALDQFAHPLRVIPTPPPLYSLVTGTGSITATGLYSAGQLTGKVALDVIFGMLDRSFVVTIG